MVRFWIELVFRAWTDSLALFEQNPRLLLLGLLGAAITALLVLVFRGREAFMEHLKANILIAFGGALITWALVFLWTLVWMPSTIRKEADLQPLPTLKELAPPSDWDSKLKVHFPRTRDSAMAMPVPRRPEPLEHTAPCTTVRGSGPNPLENVCSSILAQWALDEADHIDKLREIAQKEVDRNINRTDISNAIIKDQITYAWFTFSSDYIQYCAPEVRLLHDELLRRVGEAHREQTTDFYLFTTEHDWTKRMRISEDQVTALAAYLRQMGTALSKQGQQSQSVQPSNLEQRIPEDRKPEIIAVLSRRTGKIEVDLCAGGNAHLANDWHEVLTKAKWDTDGLGQFIPSSGLIRGVHLSVPWLTVSTDGKVFLAQNSPEKEIYEAAKIAGIQLASIQGKTRDVDRIILVIGAD
jgi:hypothetical protein